jgi:hypothetical protein
MAEFHICQVLTRATQKIGKSKIMHRILQVLNPVDSTNPTQCFRHHLWFRENDVLTMSKSLKIHFDGQEQKIGAKLQSSSTSD